MIEWVEYGVALLVLLVVGHMLVSALLIGIGPSPSSQEAVAAVVAMLPSDAKEIHELGAGFGGVALALAAARPRARVIAWERSWVPYVVARWRTRSAPNVEVRWASFFDGNLREADVVFAYLFRAAMPRLAQKLRRELRRDAVTITHTFAFRDWTALQKVVTADAHRTPVWRWQVPAVG